MELKDNRRERYEEMMKARGYRRARVWAHKDDVPQIQLLAEQLREKREEEYQALRAIPL